MSVSLPALPTSEVAVPPPVHESSKREAATSSTWPVTVSAAAERVDGDPGDRCRGEPPANAPFGDDDVRSRQVELNNVRAGRPRFGQQPAHQRETQQLPPFQGLHE